MSATLVQTIACPQPHQYSSPKIQTRLPIPPVLSHYQKWASQLASQHHTSQYNRIKFGQNGSPVHYFPLSLHFPEHYNALRATQVQYTHQVQQCWPCNLPPLAPPPVDTTLVLGPCGRSTPSLHLQNELSAAISTPLDTPAPPLKTSSSHPINISVMVPVDLLPVISAQVIPSTTPYPVLYDIPTMFLLDRIISAQKPLTLPCAPSIPVMLSPSPSEFHLKEEALCSPSSISEALLAAISSGLAVVDQQKGFPNLTESFKLSSKLKHEPQSARATLHGPSRSLPAASVPDDLDSRSSDAERNTCSQLFLPIKIPTCTIPEDQTGPPLQLQSPPSRLILGNLYLSSCPGKKVRLSGPVKGRSGVNRDLSADFQRIRELNITCVICLLSDSELSFLGAPWPLYQAAAHSAGLAIHRIPMPEGLVPLSCAALDDVLSTLIEQYTCQGVGLLVHCRGGVGRAGLVACCWALRVGLCGWIDTDTETPLGPMLGLVGGEECEATGKDRAIRRDTMQLVEHVVGVVRRRRSVKAIETYEQVRFLVDYVEYLRERGRQ